jgi:hypothetical protein
MNADTIQANADLLGIDYETSYNIQVLDAAGIWIPRIRELDIDTGDCVVGLYHAFTKSGVELVRTSIKLDYFKLVSGTWYLEFSRK